MPVNTFTAAWHIAPGACRRALDVLVLIGPVVLAILLRHAKGKVKRIHDGQAEDIDPRDDIFFDQCVLYSWEDNN